jgi:hypothetical protein
MKIKLMIALVVSAPTLALAQTNLPSGVSTTGKPAGMQPVQTPQPSQAGRMGDIEQRKPVTPSNANSKNPSQASIIKDEERTNTGSKK